MGKKTEKRFRLKHHKNQLLVLAMLVFFAVLQYSGLLKRSSANLLTQIGFSMMLAVSLNLVVGFLGELSLGHAGFMCIGAYLGSYLGSLLGAVVPNRLAVLLISMLAGGVCAAVFGFAVGLPALRLKGDYLAIVTLAFGEIVRNIFKNLPWFGGALGFSGKTYGTTLFIVTFAAVVLMLVLMENLIRSKHGRAITAIRDNEIAAKAMGVNVTFYKLLVFILSAFFAGVAGVIYGSYATPILYSFFSYNYSIEILVMVVLGGMGSITGSLLSATLITYINFMLTTRLSGDMAALKYLVYALILMVVVIFNNAPALKSFKETYSLSALTERLRKRLIRRSAEKEAGRIRDDASAWNRVPTKINMDEILSTNVTAPEGGIADKPDKPDKPEKR